MVGNTNRSQRKKNPTSAKKKVAKNKTQDDTTQNGVNHPQNQKVKAPEQTKQQIFDERYQLILGDLEKKVDEEDCPIAVAIVIDPKLGGDPIVLAKGHIYDQAKLVAMMYRKLMDQIGGELSVVPGQQIGQAPR